MSDTPYLAGKSDRVPLRDGWVVIERADPKARIALSLLTRLPECWVTADMLHIGRDSDGHPVVYRIVAWDPATRAILAERIDRPLPESAAADTVNPHAQAERWRGDSITLNTVGYRIAEALNERKDAESYVGNPVELADRLIAERDALRDELAELRRTVLGIAGEIDRPLGTGATAPALMRDLAESLRGAVAGVDADVSTDELAPCGCPVQVITGEGHQEGCGLAGGGS